VVSPGPPPCGPNWVVPHPSVACVPDLFTCWVIGVGVCISSGVDGAAAPCLRGVGTAECRDTVNEEHAHAW
jgi:hypothetical protein